MESWVGRQVGLSKGHFSLILAGQRRIDEGPARIIAALLGVDFYLLFETSSETKMDPEAIPA
jgi:transcriptional regulator with XRE-family HTH domain